MVGAAKEKDPRPIISNRISGTMRSSTALDRGSMRS